MKLKEQEFEEASLEDFELKSVLDDDHEEDYKCNPVQADIIKRHKEYMAKRKKDLEAAGFKNGKLFSSRPFTGINEGLTLDEGLFEDVAGVPVGKPKSRKYGDIIVEYADPLDGWVFEGCERVFPTFSAARNYIDANNLLLDDIPNVEPENVEEGLNKKSPSLTEDLNRENSAVEKLIEICDRYKFYIRHAFNTNDDGDIFSFVDFRCYRDEMNPESDDYYADVHFVEDHWTIDPKSTLTMEETENIQACIDEINENVNFSELPLLVETNEDEYNPDVDIDVNHDEYEEPDIEEIPEEEPIEEEE